MDERSNDVFEEPARHERPPKRCSTGQIILLVAVLLILLSVLVGAIWFLCDRFLEEKPKESPFPANPQSVSTTVSNTVMVTVPEGYTVQQIAVLMEEKGVCTAAEFLQAVQSGDFSDYDFMAAIPLQKDDGTANGRFYRLEGYLYPDTYEFYKNSSGEAAVRRFLDNFSRKAAAFSAALSASGLTMDEAVTLASIIQWETKTPTDMARVSRVFWNRLESVDYPRLQSDATTRYLRSFEGMAEQPDVAAYDSYVCRGLPVGAINNPGLDALMAAVSPSDEAICAGCYFFVTDEANGMVYYSKTYAEHLAVWNDIRP